MIIFVSLVCWSMVLAGGWIAADEYLDEGRLSVSMLFIALFMISVFSAGGTGFVRHLLKEPAAYPLLVNRTTGTLIQMQGAKRVEAQWNEMRPYIEPVTNISAAGASTSCNLHLVQPSEGRTRSVKHILVQNALGLYDCLATYEFLARYMEGDWEGLPDIHLLPGERPGFWDAYRYGFFNPWIGVPRWEERSPSSRRWMWLFTPLWTVLFWPIVMLTIAGSRLGYMPRFSAQDLAQGRHDPVHDGPMPAALQSKIKPPQPLVPEEKLLYWISMSGGTILWVGFSLKMLLLILA